MQCRNYRKKTVNQLYNYSTVLGAAIQCKPYNEITVESGTHLITVQICSPEELFFSCQTDLHFAPDS